MPTPSQAASACLRALMAAARDLRISPRSIRERAVPHDRGVTVVGLTVCGGPLEHAEASPWRQHERFGVVSGSHHVGGTHWPGALVSCPVLHLATRDH
jgi:hypothetical protein